MKKAYYRTVCINCGNQMLCPSSKAADWWACYHAVINEHTVEVWDARVWRG